MNKLMYLRGYSDMPMVRVGDTYYMSSATMHDHTFWFDDDGRIYMIYGSKMYLYMNNALSGKSVEQAKIPLDKKVVYAKAECDFRDKTDRAYFCYSFDREKWMSKKPEDMWISIISASANI